MIHRQDMVQVCSWYILHISSEHDSVLHKGQVHVHKVHMRYVRQREAILEHTLIDLCLQQVGHQGHEQLQPSLNDLPNI